MKLRTKGSEKREGRDLSRKCWRMEIKTAIHGKRGSAEVCSKVDERDSIQGGKEQPKRAIGNPG